MLDHIITTYFLTFNNICISLTHLQYSQDSSLEVVNKHGTECKSDSTISKVLLNHVSSDVKDREALDISHCTLA